jgi:hypothetical protein
LRTFRYYISAVADHLMVLAAATFLECVGISVQNEGDKNAQVMSWDAVVRTLKTKSQSLKGPGLWTPQATIKEKDDEVSVLHVAINKLSADWAIVEVEKSCVMDATRWVMTLGTAQEGIEPPLDPVLHTRMESPKLRLSMVSPSLGAASVIAEQGKPRPSHPGPYLLQL